MEKKKKILELRERLDQTLSSPELANEESLRSLVKSQLLRSSFSEYEGDFANILQKRVAEVSNFLEMLRSASGNDRDSLKAHGTSHNDWKLKQDTDQLRVMYREGPQGTPFHTLLSEGYADGPIDVCLCVSWEATLYKKWWPQYNIPSFKIIMSSCLQKVRVGEEISLVRVKVPWPVSDREAVLHNFELEYNKEDLILVLLKTIPHTEDISVSTHGFSKDGIPEAKDAVRIDLVGGFVLQKVGPNRSYFRVIANMDIKLDFVPPSLINFISRQLIGNGHKLYQKAIASVATSDNDYQEALKGPMYVRIREGLNHLSKSKASVEDMVKEKSTVHLIEESTVEMAPIEVPVRDSTSVPTSCIQESKVNTAQIRSPIRDKTLVSEIEEEETGQNLYLEGNQPSTSLVSEHRHYSKERVLISPEVEHALDILDKAIAMFHHHGSPSSEVMKYSSDQALQISEKVEQSARLNERDPPVKANMDKPSHEVKAHPIVGHFRHSNADPILGESEHEEQASFLREHSGSISGNTKEDKLNSSHLDGPIKTTVSVIPPPKLDQMGKAFDEGSVKVKGPHENGRNGVVSNHQKRRQRLCCLSFVRG